MGTTAKIYEGVEGLIIDFLLFDQDGTEVSSDILIDSNLYVVRPGMTISNEEEWTTSIVSPNIVRHVIPTGANIIPGTYKMQPWIQTADGFKGRWGACTLEVSSKHKK